MSQYAVLFDDKTNTFTLKNEEAGKPVKDSISHVYAAVVGEIPDGNPHPQVEGHLRNLADARSVDYRLVTVVNDTDNERLDAVVKEGEEIVTAATPATTLNGEVLDKDDDTALATENLGKRIVTGSDAELDVNNQDDEDDGRGSDRRSSATARATTRTKATDTKAGDTASQKV